MKRNTTNLQAKLVKVFLVHVALISIVTVASVFVAREMVEGVLMRQALEGEAAHFWDLRKNNPEADLPNTMNLLGYLAEEGDYSSIPEELHDLPEGLKRSELNGRTPLIYVEKHGSDWLYLIFDEVNVSKLVLLFGILPLAGVLVVLYLLAWLTHRQSQKVLSPVVQLAKAVDDAQPTDRGDIKIDLDEFRDTADSEITSLVSALDHFSFRLEEFVERERIFTRDASHELRTPIAVLRGSLELIERKYGNDCPDVIGRMYRTLYDMESLIETLLLLARDEDSKLPLDNVVLNEVVEAELETLRAINKDKPIIVEVEEVGFVDLQTPERVVRIMLGNLLRNAFNYTPKGTIIVRIKADGVSVSDSGVGMSKDEVSKVFTPFYRAGQTEAPGSGLGMAIVKRLCNRYRWTLRVSSKMGEGTEVSVRFPEAKLRSA